MNEEIEQELYEKTFKNGVPFFTPLDINIKGQIKRVIHNKKASIIAIDGGSGEGKTTLAVEIADFINKETGQAPINFGEQDPIQYAYGHKQFVHKLPVCFENNLRVIIYDEGGDFSSRTTMSRVNVHLNRIFEVYRAFKVIVIICLPFFNDLDTGLFKKKLIRLLVHVYGKNKNLSKFKAYGIYRLGFMRQYIRKYQNAEAGYIMVRPNFHGCFYNLSKKRDVELENFVSKLKIKETVQKDLSLQGLVSLVDVMKRMNWSYTQVLMKVKALGIKPIKKVGRTPYYDQRIIDML